MSENQSINIISNDVKYIQFLVTVLKPPVWSKVAQPSVGQQIDSSVSQFLARRYLNSNRMQMHQSSLLQMTSCSADVLHEGARSSLSYACSVQEFLLNPQGKCVCDCQGR